MRIRWGLEIGYSAESTEGVIGAIHSFARILPSSWEIQGAYLAHRSTPIRARH
jgi:hypothetical protein